MEKLNIENENYYIIFEEHQHFIQFHVYEKENFESQLINDFEDISANDFYHRALKEDVKSQVDISVKWDGCVNMNPMVDGVMVHFCDKSDIEEFHKMILACYNHAESVFDFN